MNVQQELITGFINLARLVFVITSVVVIINIILFFVNRESKKNYTDEKEGYLNFKRFSLGTAIMLIILIVIGYALFIAYNV